MADAGGPAGLSRRQVMAAGTVAAAAVLAGGSAYLSASAAGQPGTGQPGTGQPRAGAGRPGGARPRLRMTTTADLSTVLAISPLPAFTRVTPAPGDVTVSPGQVFQPFLGAGAALTDAAACVLTRYLTPAGRHALLTELFSPHGRNWRMLRVCMGSPDFRSERIGYTYADGPADPSLSRFSVARDTAFITPVIKEILAINPDVRVLATPWTPPKWMLASGRFESSDCTFDGRYLARYARYFVKFIQAYRALGIPIWAVTAQNEAVGGMFTSLTRGQESGFIGTHLGPALAAAGLGEVSIFAMDDQWSKAAYGRAVYASPAAHRHTAGIAYHGYAGGPAAMSPAYGEQHLTEWRSLVSEPLGVTMAGMAGGYIAGGVSNWARSVILWNLALDQNGEPNVG